MINFCDVPAGFRRDLWASKDKAKGLNNSIKWGFSKSNKDLIKQIILTLECFCVCLSYFGTVMASHAGWAMPLVWAPDPCSLERKWMTGYSQIWTADGSRSQQGRYLHCPPSLRWVPQSQILCRHNGGSKVLVYSTFVCWSDSTTNLQIKQGQGRTSAPILSFIPLISILSNSPSSVASNYLNSVAHFSDFV